MMAITLWIGGANAAPVSVGDYTDMYLKKNTFPKGLMEEKVFLDKDKSSEITGHVGSKTGTARVKIASTTNTLVAKNKKSNARIKPQKGELLNEITISVPDYNFEDIMFSVKSDKKATTDLVITANYMSGKTDSFDDLLGQKNWGNGSNHILMVAREGNMMESVTITSESGFKLLKKIKFSEVTAVTSVDTSVPTEVTAVPLPATVWLFGSALLGFMGFSRRSQSGLGTKISA